MPPAVETSVYPYNTRMKTPSLSEAVRAEIERTAAFVDTRDDALNIPRSSAEFLHALVVAGGWRRGVEVGTSYGFSGLWIGAAFFHNGGELITIDRQAHKTGHARDVFRRAGLEHTIRSRSGNAADVLTELEGPFDFVFLDADKENTLGYFETLWPKLAHHAVIVTDNATSHANELADFLARVREHDQLVSTLVPIGSGLELSVKVDPAATTASIDGADWVI